MEWRMWIALVHGSVTGQRIWKGTENGEIERMREIVEDSLMKVIKSAERYPSYGPVKCALKLGRKDVKEM